jgi:hypothetical protein
LTKRKIIKFPAKDKEKIDNTVKAIVRGFYSLPEHERVVTLILLTDQKTRKIFED